MVTPTNKVVVNTEPTFPFQMLTNNKYGEMYHLKGMPNSSTIFYAGHLHPSLRYQNSVIVINQSPLLSGTSRTISVVMSKCDIEKDGEKTFNILCPITPPPFLLSSPAASSPPNLQ